MSLWLGALALAGPGAESAGQPDPAEARGGAEGGDSEAADAVAGDGQHAGPQAAHVRITTPRDAP